MAVVLGFHYETMVIFVCGNLMLSKKPIAISPDFFLHTSARVTLKEFSVVMGHRVPAVVETGPDSRLMAQKFLTF